MSAWRRTAGSTAGFSLVQLVIAPVVIGAVLVGALYLRPGPGDSLLAPAGREQVQHQAREAVRTVNEQIRSTQDNIRGALSRGRPEGSLDVRPEPPGRSR